MPDRFLEVAQVTLREFFNAIVAGKDADPSWKKAIYKVICKLDSEVPEIFKSPNCLQELLHDWPVQRRRDGTVWPGHGETSEKQCKTGGQITGPVCTHRKAPLDWEKLLLVRLLRAEGEEDHGRTSGRNCQKMMIYENLFTVDVFNLQRLFLKIKLMFPFLSPETYSRTHAHPQTHLLHRKSTVAFPNLTRTMGNGPFSCLVFLFLVLRCTQCVWLCWHPPLPPQPHETPVLPCSVNHTARVYKRTDNSASI